MEKFTLKIDLTKLDKTRITERKYTNREGVEITAKEYAIDVVPLKEKKVIATGDTWELVKNSFATDSPTKDERKAQKKMNIIGEGTAFQDRSSEKSDDINHSEIPF